MAMLAGDKLPVQGDYYREVHSFTQMMLYINVPGRRYEKL